MAEYRVSPVSCGPSPHLNVGIEKNVFGDSNEGTFGDRHLEDVFQRGRIAGRLRCETRRVRRLKPCRAVGVDDFVFELPLVHAEFRLEVRDRAIRLASPISFRR